MRKNKMLRMASGLFVLTMLTTSIIGGTFAKYTTTGSASDTARVAKWGVAITTSGSLYSDAYAKGAGNLPTTWSDTPAANAITVAAATEDDNIVAPGTKSYGNGLSFGISGKPEVAVNVETNITAEDIFLAAGTYGVLVPATVNDTKSLQKVVTANDDGVYGLKNNTYAKVAASDGYDTGTTYYILTNKVTLDEAYFPVKYTLGGSTTDANVTAVAAADKLAKAIKTDAADTDETVYKATYSNISADFPANTDLGAAGPKFENENLTWEWAFTADGADPKDTILGDLIAARGDASATPKYIVVSVTGDNVTALTIKNTGDDYTVTDGTDVVANLRTMFDISLSVTQID